MNMPGVSLVIARPSISVSVANTNDTKQTSSANSPSIQSQPINPPFQPPMVTVTANNGEANSDHWGYKICTHGVSLIGGTAVAGCVEAFKTKPHSDAAYLAGLAAWSGGMVVWGGLKLAGGAYEYGTGQRSQRLDTVTNYWGLVVIPVATGAAFIAGAALSGTNTSAGALDKN